MISISSVYKDRECLPVAAGSASRPRSASSHRYRAAGGRMHNNMEHKHRRAQRQKQAHTQEHMDSGTTWDTKTTWPWSRMEVNERHTVWTAGFSKETGLASVRRKLRAGRRTGRGEEESFQGPNTGTWKLLLKFGCEVLIFIWVLQTLSLTLISYFYGNGF